MERIEKAIKFFKEEIIRLRKAPEINGCEMTPEWLEMLQIYNTAVEALEKEKSKNLPHKAKQTVLDSFMQGSEN